MTPEEMKAALDAAALDIKNNVAGAKQKAEEAMAKAADFIAKLDAKADKSVIEGLEAKLAATQAHADALDIKLQKAGSKPDSQKSFNDNLGEQLVSKANQIVALFKGEDTAKVKMEVKAASNFMIGANYTGGTYDLTSFDSDFARIQRRRPFLRQLVRVVPTSKMYISWAEQTNPQGAPATTAEGAAKPKISFDVVERSAKVEKIPAIFKISKEALDDIPYLQSEINTELNELINITLDVQQLSGSGTSPDLKGILNFAIPTFAAPTGLALNVVAPNNYDVIMAAVTQVALAFGNPTHVLVNNVDKAMMQLAKNTQGTYVLPPFTTVNGVEVAGVQVVENPGVTAGSFIVGDFSKVNLAMREEIGIQIGYENDDFTKNLVTILAEVRAVQYIKTNHLNAFVKGTFAAAITALTHP
jgi:HK97 family phage major capsid protein